MIIIVLYKDDFECSVENVSWICVETGGDERGDRRRVEVGRIVM